MTYALICIDKPGHEDVRKANRDAHLAYLKETGVARIAGPFLSDEGAMTGSLLVLDLPDRTAAEAWAAGDPYAKAGLFERVEIRAWKQVI